MRAHAGAQPSGAESIEVERKYEAPAEAVMPGADAFAELGLTADAPVVYELTATYFDAPDRALAAAGIAVRQRTGGHDAGWHLKQRLADGVREIAWPPADEAPAELFDKLRELLGDSALEPFALEPLAQMRTTRVVTLLRSGATPVIELADDRVLATDDMTSDDTNDNSGGGAVRRAWREWEAELIPGEDPALLDLVEPLLLGAGVTHSLSFAKIARASGQLVAVATRRGADPEQIRALEALDALDQARARSLGA